MSGMLDEYHTPKNEDQLDQNYGYKNDVEEV